MELYALAGLGAPPRVPDVYVVAVGEAATRAAFRIADRSGAAVAVLLGEDEVASGTAVVKALRAEVEQTTVAIAGLADAIAAHLRSKPL